LSGDGDKRSREEGYAAEIETQCRWINFNESLIVIVYGMVINL